MDNSFPTSPNERQGESVTPEALAYAFEQTHSHVQRKKRGIFYTPLAIVDQILDEALQPELAGNSLNAILNIAVLDPACGSGIFLIRAYRRILSALTEHGVSAQEASRHILLNCLFGVDQDLAAVETCRSVLASCHLQACGKVLSEEVANVVRGNSLLADDLFESPPVPSSLEPFRWKSKFPGVFKRGGFDVVVGNPPYGLSRDEQISAPENKALQSLFQETRSGKVNKYLAFMALGFALLKPKGRLSFVVPNSWLGIRSGTALRKKFLEARALKQIRVLDSRAFAEPSVEPVTFILQKDAQAETFTVLRCANDRNARNISVSACLQDREFKIPTLWSERAQRVLDKLYGHSTLVGDKSSPFLPLIALQAYAVGKGTPPQTAEQVQSHAFHAVEKRGPEYHRYLEGRDIERFKVNWSGKYLAHGDFLAEPQTLERFSGARIVIREILNPVPNLLSAAYTDELFLYNKSVLHILLKPGFPAALAQALCLMLNSKIGSFLLLCKGRKSQRKVFPKVLGDDLRGLPFPNALSPAQNDLAKLYQERCAVVSTEQQPIDDRIDQAIGDLFRLTPEDLRDVRAFLESAREI